MKYMKCIKLANGIQIIAENDFERECLEHIKGKIVSVKVEDAWAKSVNKVDLTFNVHPWDEK